MKEQEKHSLDHLFRNLSDFEMNPPTASWGQMEALLDAQANKKQKKALVWWWAIAAALIPLLIFSLFWFSPNPIKVETAQQETPVSKQKSEVPVEAQSSDHSETMVADLAPQVPDFVQHNDKADSQLKRKFQKEFNNENKLATLKSQPNETENESDLPTVSLAKVDETPEQKLTEVLMESPQPKEQDDSQIASIEFKPGQTGPQEDELAQVEFKPDLSTRSKLKETWNKIRNTDPAQLPVVEQAREGILAFFQSKK